VDDGQQQPQSQGAVPAGWYPDPAGQGQRYWDGSGWTTHTAPAAGEQQARTEPAEPEAREQAAPAAAEATTVTEPGAPVSSASAYATPGPAGSSQAEGDKRPPTQVEWALSVGLALVPIAGLIWGIYLVRKEDGRQNAGNLCVVLSLAVILIAILIFR